MSAVAGVRVLAPTAPRGGPVAVLVERYAEHARELGYRVTVRSGGGAPEPLAADEVVLAAVPREVHLAYREVRRGTSPERLVHLVSDARWADPAWRQGNGTRLLTRPAARISTTAGVAASIAPWLDARALHRLIDAGLGPDRERAALGTFLADLADRLAAFEATRSTAFTRS